MKKIINLIGLLLIFSLFSCNESASDKIIVITAADNPPYEYIVDQKVVGLEIDLINLIAEQIHKKIEIRNLDFNTLIAALQNNSADLAIAGLSNTPERRKYLDFSIIYLRTDIALLFNKKSGINNLADLSGKIVGAQLGTTWEEEAKNIANRIPNITVKSFTNALVLMEELKKGSIDAVLTEETQIKKFKNRTPEFDSFILIDNKLSSFAIAFPKGSKLISSINNAILVLESNGELQRIKKKWLNSDTW